jgi:hypothetical protein
MTNRTRGLATSIVQPAYRAASQRAPYALRFISARSMWSAADQELCRTMASRDDKWPAAIVNDVGRDGTVMEWPGHGRLK